MASYITAQTDAVPVASAADFVVATTAGVSCYGMSSGSEFVGTVYQKNSDGTYSPLRARKNPSKSPVIVTLTGITSAFTITQPGTYRIQKELTNGTVGIDVTLAS